MYPLVKGKCFSPEGGRTCSKPKHSCLRKVVSFYHAPWRKAWRLAGRAIQVLLQQTSPGFAVWNLNEATTTFQKQFALLHSGSDPWICEQCRRPKWRATLLVADAAQMYEQIDTAQVLSSFGRGGSEDARCNLEGRQSLCADEGELQVGLAGICTPDPQHLRFFRCSNCAVCSGPAAP